jgi:hypothetical protein
MVKRLHSLVIGHIIMASCADGNRCWQSLGSDFGGGVVTFVADQARETLGDEVNQALKKPSPHAAFQKARTRKLCPN